MNPWPVEAAVPEVHLPRPGHADLAGRAEVRLHRRAQRARARQRARDRRARGRRRAGQGVPARARRRGRLARDPDRLGAARPSATGSALDDFDDVDASPVRCLDADAAKAMVEEINVLRKRNESLGGVFEVRAFGLVPGPRLARLLGGAARRPDRPGACSRSRRSRACGIGDGFDLAGRPGSEAHDEIFYERGARLLPRDEPLRRAWRAA